ncbi:unnamed protein product [Cladocopium goreaui]|uniref:Uncharacterized protein n=1 Tax=Cladocopium goreaui TaxID=2562237 RepID=A0A9P1FIZ2_9DINO|nr:unnamed protein product [Cladocopium goreaui]
MKEVWEHRLPLKLSRQSFEEHDKTKQKMSGLHTEVQEEVAWHQNGKQVIRHSEFKSVVLDILSRPGNIVRLTCSWGWHRTLGTASVIIRILQMAGCEVVLYSAKLSMNPQLDSCNTIANLRTLTQNLFDDLTGVAWTEDDFEQSLDRARNLWREVWPEASIKFLRGKSIPPAPAGPPPPKAIGPIATAPIGSFRSIASSSASGSKAPAAKAMPSKPDRPAPKPPGREAMKEELKEEQPQEELKEEQPNVKKEEVTPPPGLGLVDELQAMTPAQKKVKLSQPYVREMIQKQITFLQSLLDSDIEGGDGWEEVLTEVLTDYNIDQGVRTMLSNAKISRSHKIKLMINMLFRWGDKFESNDWLRNAIRNLA